VSRGPTIERLEREWRALLDVVIEVPEQQLTALGAVGEWSVRDVLTHISTWENEFLKALPIILAGERLPHYSTLYGGIMAFNAREQERARALSLSEVREALAETHGRLLAMLSELPPLTARVEARMRRRLRQDTTQHYREHAAQIRAWKEGWVRRDAARESPANGVGGPGPLELTQDCFRTWRDCRASPAGDGSQ
jgi:hypothetical protein